MIFRKLPLFVALTAVFAVSLHPAQAQTNGVISPVGNGINGNVSLGVFNPADDSDTFTISTAGVMSDGTTSFTGTNVTGSDGTSRWVFDFSNFTLPASDIITVAANDPKAITILSKSNLDVEGTINVNGNNATSGISGVSGGADGGAGGSGGTTTAAGSNGAGSGGGHGGPAGSTNKVGGGGGGFGGNGGNAGLGTFASGAAGSGGASYGSTTSPLVNDLQGGSGGGGGGASTTPGGGGGGGGAIELGAYKTLTLGAASTINADGGTGVGKGNNGPSGGGGSGGGILIYGVNVAINSGATLNAIGGTGGAATATSSFSAGGSGGGGEIGIYYYFQTTGSGLTENVAGGASSTGKGNLAGEAGFIGTAISPTYDPQLAIPEPASYAACFGGLALLAVVARRRKGLKTCTASV